MDGIGSIGGPRGIIPPRTTGKTQSTAKTQQAVSLPSDGFVSVGNSGQLGLSPRVVTGAARQNIAIKAEIPSFGENFDYTGLSLNGPMSGKKEITTLNGRTIASFKEEARNPKTLLWE
ncbi:MAG: hypothetical protein ACLFQV_07850 [Vulcanimicrobiota bacterium]